MIVEGLFGWACDLIYGIFAGFEFINLPVDLLQTLASILEYGTWIIGADILALFTSSVLLWAGINLTGGLVIFIWRLLPLT